MTEVCILGVMHGLHKENNVYSYDDIFGVINKFSPEVIAVEIRPEDIGESVQYLEKFYPYEMVQTKIRYKNKCKLYGFDWFEEAVEGKLLWDDYFNSFDKVKIEK